jgi:hypothetical protein
MAKTIKVSGVIDRELHAEVAGLAKREGVAFGIVVKHAIECFCRDARAHPKILKGLPRDGRMTA